MPVNYARQLTAPVRTTRGNVHLGAALAFVAGATNAGAFLAVNRYTSHLTGIVSQMADALVLGERMVLLAGVSALCAFMAGAATTAIMVNMARRRGLSSAYALPLLLEAALLLAFGVLGARLNQIHATFVTLTVVLLCLTMGLQNAMITKISNALLTLLLGAFFLGGVLGAMGFQVFGYLATVPLALVLVTLAAAPAVDDIRNATR